MFDSLGLIEGGKPGQWYKMPTKTSMAKNEQQLKEYLSNTRLTSVNLVNGKFVPAS